MTALPQGESVPVDVALVTVPPCHVERATAA